MSMLNGSMSILYIIYIYIYIYIYISKIRLLLFTSYISVSSKPSKTQ